MTISIWRYSHLALAVSSFILLILASVTGVILAFEPVADKLQPYRAGNFSQLTLAQTLPALKKNYPDIIELSVDANQFVQLRGSDVNGKKVHAYIDPQNGRVLGQPHKKNEFFQWVTDFHRSLFLHEAGRFFVGLTAFLLLLITISGTMLIIRRQRGLKRFFKKIARDGFAQYYHVVLGRLSLIPIFIIALSGTYLSLARFGLLKAPKQSSKINLDAIRSKPVMKMADMEVFRSIKLSQVQTIEFPFSDDAEDYYTLKLNDRELTVNQITGDILSEVKYPATVLLTNLSLTLHTGRASAVWAVLLAISSANILFFIYSGFAITFKRRANRTKNKYKADECRFIILVGSENGTTFRFAQTVHQQLIKLGEKSYVAQLNDYQLYPKAEYLVVFAATYGLGEAPANAAGFTALLDKYRQLQTIKYSVLGFGSHAYLDFCQFAFEVNHQLSKQDWAVPLTDVHTVNDRSPQEFGLWAEAWSQQTNLTLTALPELYNAKDRQLKKFTVTNISPVELPDGTFVIRFQPERRLNITSGDLLAIYPENDHRERLYSIGMVAGQIHLSIRLHPGGIGSGYLSRLKPGDVIRAKVINNEHFHFPKNASEVVMISNGTGIAPFLGMVAHNTGEVPVYLYCGFRELKSYDVYRGMFEKYKTSRQLTDIQVALSREGEKQYVSHLLTRDAGRIGKVLSTGGVLMICGSLSMQKDVLELVETICQARNGTSVSFYQSRNQIRTDCY